MNDVDFFKADIFVDYLLVAYTQCDVRTTAVTSSPSHLLLPLRDVDRSSERAVAITWVAVHVHVCLCLQ